MPEHRSTHPDATPDASPWHVPVVPEEVAETGQHFDLVADAPTRTGIARHVGLRDLPRLDAAFDVLRPETGGLHVTGRVSATVGQNCVVTLEPITSEVEETIDLVFTLQSNGRTPQSNGRQPRGDDSADEPRPVKWDDAEPLVGGTIDLGALAVEFLILGLDPYPRQPGVVFQPPVDGEPGVGPFAALAGLAKGRDDA